MSRKVVVVLIVVVAVLSVTEGCLPLDKKYGREKRHVDMSLSLQDTVTSYSICARQHSRKELKERRKYHATVSITRRD